jgi:hypothetical protein
VSADEEMGAMRKEPHGVPVAFRGQSDRLTPVFVRTLLHVYAEACPLPENVAGSEMVEVMVTEELIYADEKAACGFWTTPKGDALVAMILKTPLPRPAFIDPRTGEAVGR